MRALLALMLSVAPASRLTYESKCLYCHSADITEGPRMTDAGWRQLIERMRRKAPLLIHKSDVPKLSAYLTQVAGRVPSGQVAAAPKKKPDRPSEPELTPPPMPPEEPGLKTPVEAPPPAEDPAARALLEAQLAAQQQLDEEGQSLLERRCSKCHSLSRVFMRLDTQASALATLERMRWKTGSGISDDDAQLLERFLKSQF